MKSALFIIICILSLSVSAQFDSNKKSAPFSAPIVSSKAAVTPEKTFTFEKAPLKSPLFPDLNAPKQANVSVLRKNEFVNPNIGRTKKLNGPEGEAISDFKGDSFLGDFRNNGKLVKIVCRDYGEIDGDRVRVYANDKIVINEILLQGTYREVVIDLVNGFNKIDFQALNQGSLGPNTAQFILYDDQGKVISSNLWNLTTGTKATLIVVKE